ncbi:MAG: DUF4124 domain-containing protein [Pseudomonadota bacterium]
MNKKNSVFQQCLSSACLVLAWASPSHAEIYKWTDANGQTHYSENKADAGKGNAEQTKIRSNPMQATSSSTPNWQEQEQEFKRRQVQKQLEQPSRPPSPAQTKSSPNENQLETDASRCDLARSINNGTARHSNGAKTDANDRMIAERDVSTYCH